MSTNETFAQFMGKFVGAKKIKDMALSDRTTPKNDPLVEVYFEDDTDVVMPLKTFQLMVSEEESDPNKTRESKLRAVTMEIVDILREYDVTAPEIQPLVQRIAMEVDNAFSHARSILWYGHDKNFVPGFDSEYEVSLLMANHIIRKHARNKSTGSATS